MLLLELTAEEQRYEVYIRAALELMSSDGDAKPQVRELVKLVGGSTTTAKRGMHAFWSYLDRLLNYRSAYPDNVAPEIIAICEKLLISCREQASNDFAQKREAIEQQQKQNQELLAAQQAINAQLQEENAELKKLYEAIKAEHSQISALLEKTESKLVDVEAANIELNKHVATLEQDATNQQTTIAQLNATIKTELNKHSSLASELESAKQQQLVLATKAQVYEQQLTALNAALKKSK